MGNGLRQNKDQTMKAIENISVTSHDGKSLKGTVNNWEIISTIKPQQK
jgi:hypothetical protein